MNIQSAHTMSFRRLHFLKTKLASYFDEDRGLIVFFDHAKNRDVSQLQFRGRQISFVLSGDGKKCVIGDWDVPGVSVYQVKSGTCFRRVEFRHKVGNLICNHDGSRIGFLTRKEFWLIDLDSGSEVQVKGVKPDFGFGSYAQRFDHFLLPSLRKNEIADIDFARMQVRFHKVPMEGQLFWISHTPDGRNFAAIDRQKNVAYFDASTFRMKWLRSLKAVVQKDHMGVGYWSGNGQLLGCVIARYSSNAMVVLRNDGVVANVLEGEACDGVPYKGTWTLSDGRQVRQPADAGWAFDLENGTEFRVNLTTDRKLR